MNGRIHVVYEGRIPNVREPWMAGSLCAQADPEAFFPEKGGSTRAAKKLCAECPVRAQCMGFGAD